ncbi:MULTISPECIES: thermonuclease family protein [Helcococcus]|uniref:Thermonuclease family protein n=1 Tax=Helcococcus bovis TaxID=3153252 RepID=A0ABW9F7J0_9FIRM
MKKKFSIIIFSVLVLIAYASGGNEPDKPPISETKFENKLGIKNLEKTESKSETVKETIKETKKVNDKKVTEVTSKPKKGNIYLEKALVKRVIDGDTIEALVNGEYKKIRFILVDTPETKHPKKGVEYYGKEASNFTKNQLEGKTVYLEKDVSNTDKYGRLLRYIWLSPDISKYPTHEDFKNYSFNAILLMNGYARLVTFPPDIKYVDEFRKFSQYAYNNKVGLYGNEEIQESNNYSSVKVTQAKKEENKTEPKETNSFSSGRIKGNRKSKIYHTPGQSHYNRIKESNVVYFDSEEEARNAGYRPAKR